MTTSDPITSSDNRWLKRVRRAAERHEDEVLVEGPKQIEDALARGLHAVVILVREDRAAHPGLDPDRTFVVGERAFRTLGDTATSQGVVALFERPRATIEEILASTSPVVALDGVQDPGNVGAIVRLAAAFDLGGVIALSGSADPFSPRAIRGSAGTVLHTPVATASGEELVAGAARLARPLLVAMPAGPSIESGLPRNAVVVLGSEGRGASRTIVDAATPFSIPISERVESLNVASAAAIVVWELARKGRA
jgi:TrmH family RNA methyltransferase